jgi:DNA polymerase III alpha subunit (gram-positive type)
MSFGDWARPRLLPSAADGDAAVPLLAEMSFTVLDVDVTGVDLRRDYAIGIAMLEVRGGRFRLADIVYCPLASSAGRTGKPDPAWREGYRVLVDAVATATVVTYNTRFVRHMIKCTADIHRLPLPYGCWVDLAAVLNGAIGREMGEVASLSRWEKRLMVDVAEGHSAVRDVFAMAQLLEIALAVAEDRDIPTLDSLLAEHRSRVWLRGE